MIFINTLRYILILFNMKNTKLSTITLQKTLISIFLNEYLGFTIYLIVLNKIQIK